MSVAVLLTCYHGACLKSFEQSVKSIFASELFPDQVIFVFDGSGCLDHFSTAFQVASNFNCESIIYLSTLVNSGPGNARNLGIEFCSCDYLAILDSDDVCSPDRLKIQSQFLKTNSKCDVVFSMMDERTSLSSDTHETVHGSAFSKSLCFSSSNPVNHGTAMFRVLSLKGKFSSIRYPSLRFGEDWIFLSSLYSAGAVFSILPKSLLIVSVSDVASRRVGLKVLAAEMRLIPYLWSHVKNSKIILIRRLLISFFVRLLPKPIYIYLRSRFRNSR